MVFSGTHCQWQSSPIYCSLTAHTHTLPPLQRYSTFRRIKLPDRPHFAPLPLLRLFSPILLSHSASVSGSIPIFLTPSVRLSTSRPTVALDLLPRHPLRAILFSAPVRTTCLSTNHISDRPCFQRAKRHKANTNSCHDYHTLLLRTRARATFFLQRSVSPSRTSAHLCQRRSHAWHSRAACGREAPREGPGSPSFAIHCVSLLHIASNPRLHFTFSSSSTSRI